MRILSLPRTSRATSANRVSPSDNLRMFAVDIPALTRAAAAERWLRLAPVMPEDGRPEMDQYGELLLAPLASNRHQVIASGISRQLQAQLGGTSATDRKSTRLNSSH